MEQATLFKKDGTLSTKIMDIFEHKGTEININQLKEELPEEKYHSIRARVYGLVDKGKLVKLARGVYIASKGEENALIVEGNGRDLSMIPDNTIDAIITDHPWSDDKSNKGGNRNFDSDYKDDSFRYSQEDFNEKFRVLKPGCFLVENLPEENENNFEYLYEIKKMAVKAGFKYYAMVPWKKGDFVANTGRKSKNSEYLLFLTKGESRSLRLDKKKMKADPGKEYFMKGTSAMLPTCFDVDKTPKSETVHQAEKPVKLYEQIIGYITKAGEIVLDQFAGSLNLVKAALNIGRSCIAFEINKEFIAVNKDILGFEKIY